MDTPLGLAPPRRRPASRLGVIGLLGCLVAVAAGVVASSGQGLLVAGAVIAFALCAVAVALYDRDPVRALIALWLFEIFNAPLSATFGYFSSTGEAIRQANELLVLLFAALTLRRLLRSSIALPAPGVLLPALGVLVFGVLGDITHEVPLTVSLVGAWLGLKFWTMVAMTLLLPWKKTDVGRIYAALTGVGALVAVLGLVDYVTHGAVSQALHTSAYSSAQGAYRAEAVHSILPNPGEYSLFMSMLFAVTLARLAVQRRLNDLLLVLLFAVSIMLSLRLKGVLSIAAVIFIIALAQTMADGRSAIVILFVGLLLGVVVYSVEKNVVTKQITTYASSESTARSRLYAVGEKIADDNAPLGVGFGRFASYPSRIYYSPIYQQYNLNLVYGLSREYPKFIDDTSWPSVIGEAGYGGFIAYAVGLVLLAVALIRRLRRDSTVARWLPLAALCSLAVLLVDALGDPTLFSWLATTTFAMVLGPAMALGATRLPARSSATRSAPRPRPGRANYSEGLRVS